MRIRIKELPRGTDELEGFDLRAYKSGHLYEVSARLAELLIVMGYAEPEMRREDGDTADDRPHRRRGDRPKAR